MMVWFKFIAIHTIITISNYFRKDFTQMDTKSENPSGFKQHSMTFGECTKKVHNSLGAVNYEHLDSAHVPDFCWYKTIFHLHL